MNLMGDLRTTQGVSPALEEGWEFRTLGLQLTRFEK